MCEYCTCKCKTEHLYHLFNRKQKRYLIEQERFVKCYRQAKGWEWEPGEEEVDTIIGEWSCPPYSQITLAPPQSKDIIFFSKVFDAFA